MAKITITLGDHSTETDIDYLGKNAKSKEKNIKRIVTDLCKIIELDKNIGLRTFTYSISFDKKSPGADDVLRTSIESIVTKMRESMSMVENVATQEEKAAFITPEPAARPLQKPTVTPPPPPPRPNPEILSKESNTDRQNSLPETSLPSSIVVEKEDASKIIPATNRTDLNITELMKRSMEARRFTISDGHEGQQNIESFSCAVKLVTTKEEITDDSTLYVYFNSKQDLEFSIIINGTTTTKLLTDPYTSVPSNNPDDWDQEDTIVSKYSQEELNTLANKKGGYLNYNIEYLLKTALCDQNATKKIQPISNNVLNSLLTYASRTVGKKLELQTSPQQQSINPSPTVAESKSQKKVVRNVKSNPDKESHRSIFAQIKGRDKDKNQAVELNQTESTSETTELQSTSFEEKKDSSITPAEEKTPKKPMGFGNAALLMSNAKKKSNEAMQRVRNRVHTPPATPPAPSAPYTQARIQLDCTQHRFLDETQPTLALYPLFTIFQKMGINMLDEKRLKLDFLPPEGSINIKRNIKSDFFTKNTASFLRKSDGRDLPGNVHWSSEPPQDSEQTAVIIDTPYWAHDAETLGALLNAVVACNIDVNHIYLRADEETLALFSSLKERFVRVSTPLSLSKPLDPLVYLHNDDDDSEDEFSFKHTEINNPSDIPRYNLQNLTGSQLLENENFPKTFQHDGIFLGKGEEGKESKESNESEISPTPSTSFSFLLNAMAQNKVATSASLALMIGGIGLACAGIVLFPGTIPLALIIAGLASVVAGVALSSRILTMGSLGLYSSKNTTEKPLLIDDSNHSVESEGSSEHLSMIL